MRRVTWSILTGLGVFLLVLALLSKFMLPGRVIKFALNEYNITHYQGTGISYFSAKQVQELSGVTMQATQTVQGDVAAGSSNIAVWKSFTATEDVTNHAPFNYASQVLAFDRKTGVLVNCCGNSVGTNKHIHVAGQGYQFPMGTRQQDYQVYDTTALKPVLFHFAGTATTGGISTYKFVASVPNQQVGTQQVPGSIVGDNAPELTLPEFYQIAETFYVDPVTGTVISATQTERLTLQDANGITRLVLFDGTLTSTPGSVASQVSVVKSNGNLISLVETIVPIAAGILGLVLLVAGVLLARRGDADPAEYEDDYEEQESRA